jgi:hypothetical protein
MKAQSARFFLASGKTAFKKALHRASFKTLAIVAHVNFQPMRLVDVTDLDQTL